MMSESTQVATADALEMINPKQRIGFENLRELVTLELAGTYTDEQLLQVFQDNEYSMAKAFERLKRLEETKKRLRSNDSYGTEAMKRRKRLSLPAYNSMARYPNGNWTKVPSIPEDNEMHDEYFGVASTAPPTIGRDYIKSEFNVPSSQKNEEQCLSPKYEDVSARDENDVFNTISSYCLEKTDMALQMMFEKMFASTTEDTLKLLDAACDAYRAADAQNPNGFERLEETKLIQDVVMHLPHTQVMDKLAKPVRPLESELQRLETRVSIIFAKIPADTEERVEVLSALCQGHVGRLQAFIKAKEQLHCIHASINDDFEGLHDRVNAAVDKIALQVKDALTTLEGCQAQEDAAAKAIQALVDAHRSKSIALGVSEAAAATRAQIAVFSNPQNDAEVAAVLAQQTDAMGKSQAAMTILDGTRAIESFYFAVRSLLQHVHQLRQSTMQQAVEMLTEEQSAAMKLASEKLQLHLPALCKELITLDTTLVNRSEHAKKEINCERVRLEQHNRLMGPAMASTRRRDLENSIQEYHDVVQSCALSLKKTSAEQYELWTQMRQIIPSQAFEVIVLACRVHWPSLHGPLRQVFSEFADFKLPPTSPPAPEEPAALASNPLTLSTALSTTEASISNDLVVLQPKFKVGDKVYAKFATGNDDAYALGQVIGLLPNRVYLLVFPDGDQYSMDEPYLFTPEEYQHIQKAIHVAVDEPTSRSGCTLM